MVPVLKKLEVLTLLNLLPFLFYGASFDLFMTIKTIYISCVYRDTHLYVRVTKRMKKIMLNTTSIRRMRVVFNLIFFTSFVTYL